MISWGVATQKTAKGKTSPKLEFAVVFLFGVFAVFFSNFQYFFGIFQFLEVLLKFFDFLFCMNFNKECKLY